MLKMVSRKSLDDLGVATDITYKNLSAECVKSGVYKNFEKLQWKLRAIILMLVIVCQKRNSETYWNPDTD